MNRKILLKAWGELDQSIEVLDSLVIRLSSSDVKDAGKDNHYYRFQLGDAKYTAIELSNTLQLMKSNLDERIKNEGN